MALIRCPHCGKPVSDHAARCPHCGIDTPATLMDGNYNTSQPGVSINQHENHRTGSNRKQWLWVLVPLLLLAGVITGFVLWNNNQNKAYELEQARQDSIAAVEEAEAARLAAEAAREQARQDSIAAEKARQDSIARWDFYTANEMLEVWKKSSSSLSTFRSFCQRHGLKLLYDKDYKQEVAGNDPEGDFVLAHRIIGGKDCQVVTKRDEWGWVDFSLKPTSDIAFGVVLTVYYDVLGKWSVNTCLNTIDFAFATKEARNKVMKQLDAKGITQQSYGYGYYIEQKNNLYWLLLTEFQ